MDERERTVDNELIEKAMTTGVSFGPDDKAEFIDVKPRPREVAKNPQTEKIYSDGKVVRGRDQRDVFSGFDSRRIGMANRFQRREFTKADFEKKD